MKIDIWEEWGLGKYLVLNRCHQHFIYPLFLFHSIFPAEYMQTCFRFFFFAKCMENWLKIERWTSIFGYCNPNFTIPPPVLSSFFHNLIYSSEKIINFQIHWWIIEFRLMVSRAKQNKKVLQVICRCRCICGYDWFWEDWNVSYCEYAIKKKLCHFYTKYKRTK